MMSAGADFPEGQVELRSFLGLLCGSGRWRFNGGVAALVHHMSEFVIQMQGIDGRHEASPAGTGDGHSFLANASGKILRHRVGEKTPYLNGVSRQQCSAKAVQVCEHSLS
jgi:hypothetical protein